MIYMGMKCQAQDTGWQAKYKTWVEIIGLDSKTRLLNTH